MDQTKRADFEQDNGWQGLDEQELYSQHEYEEYERQRQQEIQRLIDSGDVSYSFFLFASIYICHSSSTLSSTALLGYLIVVPFSLLV